MAEAKTWWYLEYSENSMIIESELLSFYGITSEVQSTSQLPFPATALARKDNI